MTSPASTPAHPLGAALASTWSRWCSLVSATGRTAWVVGAVLLALGAAELVRGRPLDAVAAAGVLCLVAVRTSAAVARPRRRAAAARARGRAAAEAEVRARVRQELARSESGPAATVPQVAAPLAAAAPATPAAPSGPPTLAVQHRAWDLERGRPSGEPLSTAGARGRFDAGEPVTVLVGSPDAPDAPTSVLEVRDRGREVVVTRLDRHQRPSLRHMWAVPTSEPGWPEHRLLLREVEVTGYDDDRRPPDHAPTTTETYRFTPDGTVSGERVHVLSGEVSTLVGHDPAGLQVEDVPRFGDWAALLDSERSTSP
ncbi:hypothetical protein [Quadrisphaera setariae]|uniref:DUF4178 domain-containing protein n=1 Tax=Quadrisphaera setariae TaxID=2593304 RepID=A0A5C8ZL93_9ACTN|nr:hypothetical protein [Quadrisphaera setariae]TXR57909.1 hypothetical protein FMM08_01295 [Quadrisphaera setariae]